MNKGPIHCQFCNQEVLRPTGKNILSQTLCCPNCQAIYWLETTDDKHELSYHAADHLGVSEDDYEKIDKIECKMIPAFDRLLWHENQPPQTGIELCLVFARIKTP